MNSLRHFTNLSLLLIKISFLIFLLPANINAQTDPNNPNILVILADDLGIDVSNGYQNNTLMPVTPEIDALRASGLTFKNAWATPKCTPSRATIMSGHYGVKTGVTGTPGDLSTDYTSVFNALSAQTSSAYASAYIGKWHMSSPVDYNHPSDHGIDHFEGFFSSSVADYYAWEKVTNGVISNETDYLTSHLTDSSIDWINNQNSPWFVWLAHGAPHAPFHVPPPDLYQSNPVGTNIRKYIAAIEAMDTEIGRLLDNIPAAVLNNTIIFYLGDNGTPGTVIQNYSSDHAKSTVYQGGVNVPLVVSGAGVTRTNEEETALVQATDLYATILDVASGVSPGGIYNSFSFHPMLSSSSFSSRTYCYTELDSGSDSGFAIRNSQYKLIEFDDNCVQEFYDISIDDLEQNNLINSLTAAQEAIKEDLENEATRIRGWWSCQDLILNGNETIVDDCSDPCTNDNTISQTNTGCCVTPSEPNIYQETISGDTRMISTNNFPDHDYCHTNNNVPSPIYYNFEMDATPILASEKTSILTGCNRPDFYFGVALNGVLLAPAPAAPFIFENPNTGEFNWDWVFEPTNNQGSGSDFVRLDCSSAHTGGQGYHYHGNMFEYIETHYPGLSTTSTPPANPVHIGWAADGYPILYRFGPDGAGGLTELMPSYTIKSGNRPGDGISAPCGAYNGKYTVDYEYDAVNGDLDECNGISRNVTITSATGTATFSYFYVITSNFPQIPRCFSGTRDITFDNANSGNPLPLELQSFDVRHQEDLEAIELQWTTESEVNISHFEIERADNARQFETIKVVNPEGSLTSRHIYQLFDQEYTTGTMYYRIKIVDYDNSYVYTPIRQVTISGNAIAMATYPNPTSDHLTIDINNLNTDYQVQIMDINGKIVADWERSVSRKNDFFQKNISLKNRPTGIYFVQLKTPMGTSTSKVLKID